MKALEKVVSESLETLRDREDRKGLWLAIGTGVGIGAPVALFFLGLTAASEMSFIGPMLGWLALGCTGVGTLLAVRAKNGWRAFGWVFFSNVVPPTLVCAPTIYGVVFSAPSGFAAFLLVLPAVLVVRWSASKGRGHDERERLIGAAFAAISATAMIIASIEMGPHYLLDPAYRFAAVLGLPALIAAITAFALAASAFAREMGRATIVVRAKNDGWRVERKDSGETILERVLRVGGGPLRTAETSERIGEVAIAPARTGFAVLFALTGAALVFAALIAIITVA